MQGKAIHLYTVKHYDTIQCLESIIELKVRKLMKGRTIEDPTKSVKVIHPHLMHSNS